MHIMIELVPFSQPMGDRDTSALSEMFQYSSLSLSTNARSQHIEKLPKSELADSPMK